jgi:predicted site-specific integrase-resolvase
MKYKISEYAKLNHVQYRTVWNWINKGKVKIERTKTGRVLIVVDEPVKDQTVAVYARVSSSENKDNLERQAQRLIDYANAKGYKVEKVVKEIGSGLNDNRPKLQSLLADKSINLILVEHKDRLTRFGFNYIQTLLANSNRTVEVVNNLENPKEDLIADFTSVITSFCAKIYGQRRSKRKTEKLIKELEQSND